MSIPDGAELTPALRQALDGLVSAIEGLPTSDPDVDVAGYTRICISHDTLCSPLTRAPCLKKQIVSCTIVKCTNNTNCPWNDTF